MGSACLLCGRGRWGVVVEGGGIECNRTPQKGISQSLIIIEDTYQVHLLALITVYIYSLRTFGPTCV